jgi:hypothetical protein
LQLNDGEDTYEISRHFSLFKVYWTMYKNGEPIGFISPAEFVTVGRQHYKLKTYSQEFNTVFNMLVLYVVQLPNLT